MAVIEGMEEREQKDFDMRLNAPERGPQRPSQGVETLWGVMGRPGVAPGSIPAARPRTASKVGGE